MPLLTADSLLTEVPDAWFLEVTCRCEKDPPRSIPIRGLAQVAKQFVCVRCGKHAQFVVLVYQRTPRLVADHYSPQIVRMTVLER